MDNLNLAYALGILIGINIVSFFTLINIDFNIKEIKSKITKEK